jgi:hypothetical protein
MATNPTLLTQPIATNGAKNVIPNTTSTAGAMSQDQGFPAETALPLGAGGVAPTREDFNGAFNLLSGIAFMAQKGFVFNFDNLQDYYVGCVVVDPIDGQKYECIVDAPAGTGEPHVATSHWTILGGFSVGDIKMISYNGAIEAGWLLCDGGALSRTTYAKLFGKIGTTYGSGDGSTTFNLPNYTGGTFPEGASTAGTSHAAGLPNISGAHTWITNNANAAAIGCFYPKGNVTVSYYQPGAGTYTAHDLGMDASRLSSIYGASTTVQPKSLTTRFIIKYQ